MSLITAARLVKRRLYIGVRLGRSEWSQTVASSPTPIDAVKSLPDGLGVSLPALGISLRCKSSAFVLDAYHLAIRLKQKGANFEDVPNQSWFRVTINGLHANIRTWDDLFILNEIYSEGTYRIEGLVPSIIVDIGANVCHASLYFANKFPSAKVFAFEPVQETFSRAEGNLQINTGVGSRVAIKNIGLADSDGEVDIEYSDVVPGRVGIFPMPDDGKCRGAVKKCRINLRRASDELSFLNDVDVTDRVLMKIDCEGAEYAILSDLAEQRILGRVDAILMEWHRRIPSQDPNELTERLTAAGFVVLALGDTDAAGGMIYAVNCADKGDGWRSR